MDAEIQRTGAAVLITLAVALADKWNKSMTGIAYFVAMFTDYWIVVAIMDGIK